MRLEATLLMRGMQRSEAGIDIVDALFLRTLFGRSNFLMVYFLYD